MIPPDFVPTAFDLFAHRVDTHFPQDVHLLGECGFEVIQRIIASREGNQIPERKAVYPLLLNGLTTAMAASELWRRGFLLQVGILLRNALETIATAAVISMDRAAHDQYRQGRFDSSEAFTRVKKLWPEIGPFLARASGVLSNEFVHVGESYQGWQRISAALTEKDLECLKSMLLPLKVAFHVADVLSEMVCLEVVTSPRYWKNIGPNAYSYFLNEKGRERTRQLFREELQKLGDMPS